jgi:hypothetical protein
VARTARYALLIALLAAGAWFVIDRLGSDGPSVADGPPQQTADRIGDCLEQTDLNTVVGPARAEEDAPSHEVVATRGAGGPGALIAVYATAEEADGAFSSIEDSVERAEGGATSIAADRHGAVTVVWIPDPPEDGDRDAVLDCLG